MGIPASRGQCFTFYMSPDKAVMPKNPRTAASGMLSVVSPRKMVNILIIFISVYAPVLQFQLYNACRMITPFTGVVRDFFYCPQPPRPQPITVVEDFEYCAATNFSSRRCSNSSRSFGRQVGVPPSTFPFQLAGATEHIIRDRNIMCVAEFIECNYNERSGTFKALMKSEPTF